MAQELSFKETRQFIESHLRWGDKKTIAEKANCCQSVVWTALHKDDASLLTPTEANVFAIAYDLVSKRIGIIRNCQEGAASFK